MNAVGTDQDVAACGVDVRAGAVEEIGGDAAFVLREGAQPAAGMDDLGPEPLLDGAVDDALQPSAMDRELRDVMTRIDAAGLAPDLLAVAVEILELVGADREVVELLHKA
jgi:hypothetical protein